MEFEFVIDSAASCHHHRHHGPCMFWNSVLKILRYYCTSRLKVFPFMKEMVSMYCANTWDTKGPLIRPRCIGAMRSHTQCNQSIKLCEYRFNSEC
jgi:hypothetical protein